MRSLVVPLLVLLAGRDLPRDMDGALERVTGGRGARVVDGEAAAEVRLREAGQALFGEVLVVPALLARAAEAATAARATDWRLRRHRGGVEKS